MRRTAYLATALLAAGLASAGCKPHSNNNPPPIKPSAQASAPVAPASSTPPPPAPPPEAPFTVTMDTPEKVPAHGAVTLKLKVTATKEFKAKTTITVQLPAGAKLTSGKASEVIDPLPEGETTRSFTVTSAKQLSADDPVKIVVEAHGPEFGARAERVFPQK